MYGSLKSSNLIKEKFKDQESKLKKLLPGYANERNLTELKIDGLSVIEKEKQAIKKAMNSYNSS